VYKIGDYYHSKRLYKAAAGRFQQVLEQFPDFSLADDVLLNWDDPWRS